VAAVLLPLGLWLALTRAPRAASAARPARAIPHPVLILLAAVVGCVGGIYGIGGGSILAPILIGAGRPPSEVAPAALASTFVTSVAGVVTFTILSAHQHGSVAPDWPTGIALGIGGLVGAYTGARIQSRLPDALIRRLVGILVLATAPATCGLAWPDTGIMAVSQGRPTERPTDAVPRMYGDRPDVRRKETRDGDRLAKGQRAAAGLGHGGRRFPGGFVFPRRYPPRRAHRHRLAGRVRLSARQCHLAKRHHARGDCQGRLDQHPRDRELLQPDGLPVQAGP
jgi:Sulfite exporter TauE/SafE